MAAFKIPSCSFQNLQSWRQTGLTGGVVYKITVEADRVSTSIPLFEVTQITRKFDRYNAYII